MFTKACGFSCFHLTWCCLQNTEMKILKSSHISPFGGLNFVLEEFEKQNVGKLLKGHLPVLPAQCKYSWKDILYAFWSIYFCGGDCIEDIQANLGNHLKANPIFNVPSSDRLLDRFKELTLPKSILKSPRGLVNHEFGINKDLNDLNIKLLKSLKCLSKPNLTLDYDNTIIFTNKLDSAKTYKKAYGYQPGVGIIGHNIIYVENRNGNSNPRTLQEETLYRMFSLLDENGIKVTHFRADSGSYLYEVVRLVNEKVNTFYIKARMSNVVAEAIAKIDNWTKVVNKNEILYRGDTEYEPFFRARRDRKSKEPINKYRLVVTKTERKDKQINAFTNEAFLYSCIITNDKHKNTNQIVDFYNQRGATEKEFDILKNDFGWNNLPFSKLEQNTVFMLFSAMCRNLYEYIIEKFSKTFNLLKPNYRIKKFIFRFITIPAKWIKNSRQHKLRIYGDLHFKT